MPMVSAPPGRFSTTIGWPSRLPSSGDSRRAKLSVGLPAACGAIKRIGRSGYWAAAGPAAMTRQEKKKAAKRGLWTNMRLLPTKHEVVFTELRADFAAFIRVAVDVDIQATGLEYLELLRRQLGGGR